MMKINNKFAVISSILGMFAVLLGAFGAHYLKTKINPTSLEVYKTANFYHFIHSIILLILSNQKSHNQKKYSFYFILFGLLLFCGSLYLLSITDIRWLGAITPIGGVLLILGWLSMTLRYIKE